MKKRLLALTTALTFLLAFAAAASAVTIDFDTLPDGNALAKDTVLTDQYVAWGVTFSGFENGATVPTYVGTSWTPDTGMGNYWSNLLPDGTDDNYGNDRRDVLRVSFTAPAANIGLDFNDLGADPAVFVTFNFYDNSGSLLGSEKKQSDGWDPLTFGYTNVAYFEILQPLDAWALAVDNLTFDTAPVPIPAAVWLLGSGLVGLIGLRRRMRG